MPKLSLSCTNKYVCSFNHVLIPLDKLICILHPPGFNFCLIILIDVCSKYLHDNLSLGFNQYRNKWCEWFLMISEIKWLSDLAERTTGNVWKTRKLSAEKSLLKIGTTDRFLRQQICKNMTVRLKESYQSFLNIIRPFWFDFNRDFFEFHFWDIIVYHTGRVSQWRKQPIYIKRVFSWNNNGSLNI